ncbi:MAG: JAB domain-containing protein [Ferruginibacter sp.]
MNTEDFQFKETIAEVELVYKTTVKDSERAVIGKSKDAYEILLRRWDLNKIELVEEFKVLLLNRANKVLGCLKVSSGGLTGTVADPKLILVAVVKSASCAIVLCHNHPSGSLKPSRADEVLTQKIKQACSLIDVSVLDHLIITKESYFSFGDEGLL